MHDTPKSKREMEWQFSAASLEATRDWIARQPSDRGERRFAPRGAIELRDTYYDSADWMIFRAGFALRLREKQEESGDRSSEITLKSLAPSRAGFASRLEFSQLLPQGDIRLALEDAQGLGGKLRSLVGERPLQALFRAHTRRERQLLLEADTDLPLAEVDLDQCSIESPDGRSRQLVRIEVECMNAEPAVLAPLVEQLRLAAGLEPTTQSKFRAGLDVAGLIASLPVALPQRELTATQPFARSQLAVLTRYFSAVVEQEPEARAGSATAVHEMRVAARHLDTLLRAFAPHGPLWAVRSRATVRALVKRLGQVRDCDVQIAHLESVAQRDAAEPLPMDSILQTLRTERDTARLALIAWLAGEESRSWMQLWRQELARTHVPTAPSSPTAVVVRDLVRSQARKLRKRAERIDEESLAEDFHEVRIRAKRLRYTVGAFASLLGESAVVFLKALTRLQDLLGTYHDASVRAHRFLKLAADPTLAAPVSFVLGRLVESETPAQTECRRGFPKAWRRVRGKRWKALRATMKDLAGIGS